MLNRDLPTTSDNYIEKDGGLLVKNVILLANGTWTDSAEQTPLFYPQDVLMRDAGKWPASTYWARHSGGAPRNIVTDRLGDVLNQHYDPTVEGGAIMGEVFYDRLTQASRDGAALALAKAQAGKPLSVSVEHGGEEKWDPIEKRFMATSLAFYGLASVDKGACTVCGLPKKANEAPSEQVREMEDKELKQILADQEARIMGEMDKRMKSLTIPADSTAKVAELGAALDKHVKELEAAKSELANAKLKIDALEKKPSPKTIPEPERLLEEAKPTSRWDARTGRVMGN